MFAHQQYPLVVLYGGYMSNILLIDPDHHEYIQVMLEGEGYTVCTAPTALTPHLTKNIDLLILDAGVNGVRLSECTAIKGTDIPILVMSVIPAFALRAAHAGATAFLEKPFDMTEFLGIVERLIASVSL